MANLDTNDIACLALARWQIPANRVWVGHLKRAEMVHSCRAPKGFHDKAWAWRAWRGHDLAGGLSRYSAGTGRATVIKAAHTRKAERPSAFDPRKAAEAIVVLSGISGAESDPRRTGREHPHAPA